MEEEEPPEENSPPLRRSLRRMALTELNDNDSPPSETGEETPRHQGITSPDEMVILQRGRRKKPLTWSPVDYDKLGPPRELTPDREVPSGHKLMNSKLRRRLVLSPGKNSNNFSLGKMIAQKIKSLPRCEDYDHKMESDQM